MALNIQYLCGLVAENDLRRFAEALLNAATSNGCECISFAPAMGSPDTVVELCTGLTGSAVFSFTVRQRFSEDFQVGLFGAFRHALEHQAGWKEPKSPIVGEKWRVCREPH